MDVTGSSPVAIEVLPGEGGQPPLTGVALAIALLQKFLTYAALTALSMPAWPLYLLGRLALERPPNVPSARRLARALGWIATEQPPAPGLPVASRVALFLRIGIRIALIPGQGLAWYLDELLYGRKLDAQAIEAPIFEISAARSGSTQLAHYLEDDPHVVGPNVLQTLFPYLWLWKLVAHLPTPSHERIRAAFIRQMPPEYIERHEMDPLRTDTFEVQFLAVQLGAIPFAVGPRVARQELAPSRVHPDAAELWHGDFLRFIRRLGQKTLRHAGPGRRLFIKGHFLSVASELEGEYPDARFLTVLRAPSKRVQSVVNFHRCQPHEVICGSIPWPWLVELALDAEVDYCEREQAWFTAPGKGRRYAVRFDDYVHDLVGTMRRVYNVCLDQDEPSPHVPRVHAPRQRTNYSIDRSLAQLGIDETRLNERLAAYRAWVDGKPAP